MLPTQTELTSICLMQTILIVNVKCSSFHMYKIIDTGSIRISTGKFFLPKINFSLVCQGQTDREHLYSAAQITDINCLSANRIILKETAAFYIYNQQHQFLYQPQIQLFSWPKKPDLPRQMTKQLWKDKQYLNESIFH